MTEEVKGEAKSIVDEVIEVSRVEWEKLKAEGKQQIRGAIGAGLKTILKKALIIVAIAAALFLGLWFHWRFYYNPMRFPDYLWGGAQYYYSYYSGKFGSWIGNFGDAPGIVVDSLIEWTVSRIGPYVAIAILVKAVRSGKRKVREVVVEASKTTREKQLEGEVDYLKEKRQTAVENVSKLNDKIDNLTGELEQLKTENQKIQTELEGLHSWIEKDPTVREMYNMREQPETPIE